MVLIVDGSQVKFEGSLGMNTFLVIVVLRRRVIRCKFVFKMIEDIDYNLDLQEKYIWLKIR